MSIQTDFTPAGDEVQQLFEFTLKAEAFFEKVGSTLIKVIIGCFEETTINGALKLPAYDSTVVDFTEDAALFKLFLEKYDTQDSTTEFKTYPLEKVISWTTDISLCYASHVSLVTDETGEDLSNDTKIVLLENPTVKDTVTGLVTPQLKIDRKTPFY